MKQAALCEKDIQDNVMHFALYPPPAEIAHLVRYFWVMESTPNSYTPPRYLALADSSPELMFQYGHGFKEFTGMAHWVAQRSVSTWRHLHEKVGVFGVRFYPYAMRQVIGIDATELNDTAYDIEAFFGNQGKHLAEKVANARNLTARIEVLTSFLLEMAKDRDRAMEYVTRFMINHNGNVSTRFIQKATNLSLRQFQRKFKNCVGFSPKYFMRMLRFQSARRQYMSGHFNNLTDLAYACGYADQSHFCREFMEFAHISPAQYFNLINQTETEANIIRKLVTAKDTPPGT